MKYRTAVPIAVIAALALSAAAQERLAPPVRDLPRTAPTPFVTQSTQNGILEGEPGPGPVQILECDAAGVARLVYAARAVLGPRHRLLSDPPAPEPTPTPRCGLGTRTCAARLEADLLNELEAATIACGG